ncbi:MAG: hypothetical protein JWO82_3799 [Akkermansiaceae bacterium]|nr:hypothetical protein [Akkermansiaceae bacterium]
MGVDGRRFRFDEVRKEDWQEGDMAFGGVGGHLYVDSSGRGLFSVMTRI